MCDFCGGGARIWWLPLPTEGDIFPGSMFFFQGQMMGVKGALWLLGLPYCSRMPRGLVRLKQKGRPLGQATNPPPQDLATCLLVEPKLFKLLLHVSATMVSNRGWRFPSMQWFNRGLSGPLNRALHATLSLLRPHWPREDPLCDRACDWEALSRPISHPHTGRRSQPPRSKPPGTSTLRLWCYSV